MMICETVCEITNPEHYVFTLDGDLSQRSLRLKGTVTSDFMVHKTMSSTGNLTTHT
jgi:hypothetical protein